MQVEGTSRNSIELLQATLSIAPEALNAIDVMCALHKLIVAMIDSIMLTVADINQAVVAAPPIRVDDGSERDATANNGLQSRLFTVRHDLGINASIALEDAEDDGLATGSSTSLATNPSSPEVRFVHFDFARGKRRGALTFLCDAFSDFEKDRGHATAREFRQMSGITSCQIERKVANQEAEFTLSNFRPPVIAV